MPTVEWNLNQWGAVSNWANEGDSWSARWGGVEMQWYGSIFPRIQRFLPVETILEIAPGFGRWTQYLKEHCQSLIAAERLCQRDCEEHLNAGAQ
jgi:hypothetical protein